MEPNLDLVYREDLMAKRVKPVKNSKKAAAKKLEKKTALSPRRALLVRTIA
jgi:hypothetical protein